MRIIGCCGAARAGKSTSADLLCRNGFTHYSFANSLKEYCAKEADFDRTELGWDWTLQSWTGPKTDRGRRFLQETSNEKRAVNQDFFIEELFKVIRADWEKGLTEVAVIDDFRYINECNLLLNFKQPLLYISSDKAESDWLTAYDNEEPWATHVSEIQWRLWLHTYPLYCYQIHNDRKDKSILKLQLDRFLDYSENFVTAPDLYLNNEFKLELL
jgi:hypothetical protein